MRLIHGISITSFWKDVFYTREAAECWFAVALVLTGCSLAANSGVGSCLCGQVPGFTTMCCSRLEIFSLGIFLFMTVWSILHSFVFYPILYQRAVLDYQRDTSSKPIQGVVKELRVIQYEDGPEYHLIIQYTYRQRHCFQIIYEDPIQHRDEGDFITLRLLKSHPRSAVPEEAMEHDFWPADSLRWSFPLLVFIFLGGLPALLFYINYPWPCFVFVLSFSIPASILLSNRRIVDVTNQVYTRATPVIPTEENSQE
jgi:hypothetical protein